MRQNFSNNSLYRRLCISSAHEPPMHVVYPPGLYRHVCRACGQVTTFTVPGVFW